MDGWRRKKKGTGQDDLVSECPFVVELYGCDTLYVRGATHGIRRDGQVQNPDEAPCLMGRAGVFIAGGQPTRCHPHRNRSTV